MLEVHGGLLAWTVVTFLILLVILKKVAWGPILSALESREAEIRDALNSAAKAREDAEKASRDYEELVKKARAEAQQIVADGKAAGERVKNDIETAASGKADEIIEKAKAQIDVERVKAVREGAPNSRLIVDANEAWSQDMVQPYSEAFAEMGGELIEQPLPSGHDELLAAIPHPVPICADESCHVSSDLNNLTGRYDLVNIKLDKTGGLTEALNLARAARAKGFDIMVGCMLGTSLAMAPAILVATLADFVDLGGPLLLSKDRDEPLVYRNSHVMPPEPELWG